MLKTPYGISNFKLLREYGYFYQDRTMFIPKLESWPTRYLIFLRPRKFGKSLFLNMLGYYYGLEYSADFKKLFGGLYVGDNPTAEANSYLVLKFDFSSIDTQSLESTQKGFMRNVLYGAQVFLSTYKNYFSEKDQLKISKEDSPEGIIKAIAEIFAENAIDRRIYLMIDEYDQFANELLSSNSSRFNQDLSSSGFVRKFYESIKELSAKGIIGRMFLTGVSPFTLDALTSGFNILDNISFNPIFHSMMGFKSDELAVLFNSMQKIEDKNALLNDLKNWYNGYTFCPDAIEKLFNPDMILYFLKEYTAFGEYPSEMMDINIISDYKKIKNIFNIDNQNDKRKELLEKVLNDGFIDFKLIQIFNAEEAFSDNDFLSLLYYLGMLTYSAPVADEWRFVIPNYVIKKLYYEYFRSILLADTELGENETLKLLSESVKALIMNGNLHPFLEIAEKVLLQHHSNRDELHYSEKHLQTLLIGLLFPFNSFIVHSEYESGRNYPDIFLEKTKGSKAKYEIVLELKYLKKHQENKADETVETAKNQLDIYMKTERFAGKDVLGFYALFISGKLHSWGRND